MALDVKEAITRPIGPLPAWGWGVVIGGGYLIYRWLFGSEKVTVGNQAGATDYGSGTTNGGGGGGSGSTTIDDTTNNTDTDNQNIIDDIDDTTEEIEDTISDTVNRAVNNGTGVSTIPPVERQLTPEQITTLVPLFPDTYTEAEDTGTPFEEFSGTPNYGSVNPNIYADPNYGVFNREYPLTEAEAAELRNKGITWAKDQLDQYGQPKYITPEQLNQYWQNVVNLINQGYHPYQIFPNAPQGSVEYNMTDEDYLQWLGVWEGSTIAQTGNFAQGNTIAEQLDYWNKVLRGEIPYRGINTGALLTEDPTGNTRREVESKIAALQQQQAWQAVTTPATSSPTNSPQTPTNTSTIGVDTNNDVWRAQELAAIKQRWEAKNPGKKMSDALAFKQLESNIAKGLY